MAHEEASIESVQRPSAYFVGLPRASSHYGLRMYEIFDSSHCGRERANERTNERSAAIRASKVRKVRKANEQADE